MRHHPTPFPNTKPTTRRRARGRVAALAGLAVTAALTTGVGTSGAAASDQHTQAPTAGAQYAAQDETLIQGVIVDLAKNNRPIDDVQVQAIGPGDKVVASALTYASPRPDGVQHGYFFLRVPAGTYILEITKRGYGEAFRTVTAEADTPTSLGQMQISPATSRVQILNYGPEAYVITEGEAITTSFGVSANFGPARGTGRIIDRYTTPKGKKRSTVVKEFALKGGNGRNYKDKIRNLAVGKHRVYLSFAGAPGVGNATSKPYIVVVKPKR